MGRDARYKKVVAVTLTPADYWEFRTRVTDLEIAKRDAIERAKRDAEKAVAAAAGKFSVYFASLGKKHGFDPAVNYRWDDTTLTLTPIDK